VQLARPPRREGRLPTRRLAPLAATALAVVLGAPGAATAGTAVETAPADAASARDAPDAVDVADGPGENENENENADATDPARSAPDDPGEGEAAGPDENASPDEELDAEGPEEEGEAAVDTEEEDPASATIEPPRVDGIYVGLTGYVPLTFARVRNLETDGVFVGPGGSFRAGEAVYPWMTIGIEITGELAYRADQRIGQGAFLVDIGFLPMPKRPLSLHVGFGVGGGAVRQDGIEGRQGYGGAAFKATARYEFFPFAKRKRPLRGGGLGLGPEVGWFGLTPAKRDRPMSNTVYLGLTTTFYFGA